ncbi:hypothetical protein DIPPA_02460 [Diplonema papillatum]|nr:hypothetical protein DIPPA_02460 [Diplonema papillatum]
MASLFWQPGGAGRWQKEPAEREYKEAQYPMSRENRDVAGRVVAMLCQAAEGLSAAPQGKAGRKVPKDPKKQQPDTAQTALSIYLGEASLVACLTRIDWFSSWAGFEVELLSLHIRCIRNTRSSLSPPPSGASKALTSSESVAANLALLSRHLIKAIPAFIEAGSAPVQLASPFVQRLCNGAEPAPHSSDSCPPVANAAAIDSRQLACVEALIEMDVTSVFCSGTCEREDVTPRPVYLDTVRARVLRGDYYAGPVDFAMDLHAVFTSALLRLPEGGEDHTLAGALLAKLESPGIHSFGGPDSQLFHAAGAVPLLSEADARRCRLVLAEVKAIDSGHHFHRPAHDCTAARACLPDDLQVAEVKLSVGLYASPLEFMEDVTAIFTQHLSRPIDGPAFQDACAVAGRLPAIFASQGIT